MFMIYHHTQFDTLGCSCSLVHNQITKYRFHTTTFFMFKKQQKKP